MHRTPRLAHAPVAIARRHERDLGGALSLAQLKGHPPLSRRYLKPTPLDKLDQWSLSHAAGYLSWWEVVILRRLLSKGVALVAARADDGEIYSRARALHLNENVHFFLPGRVVARWGSGSDSANSATKIILGHARAHVSSPDLVTHIAQHDAGLHAPRRPVVTRRCVGLSVVNQKQGSVHVVV